MKPANILLVEDNDGDILLTVEALKEGRLFNKIDVVKDGREALHYIEKRGIYKDTPEPDLILLDVNLPKMSGHEVLLRIKESENNRHIPVVIFTTSSTQADILKSYRHHANCYVTKPVDVDDFQRVITSIENFWLSIVQLPKRY